MDTINNMKVIYANTWNKLTLKMMGYHHDHCYHYYIGKTDDVPDKYKEYITEDKAYCFIYKEDEPYVKE